MGAGGKKAKAKDKNGKAGAKQKVKKTKTTEETEDQPTTESPAPGSPDIAVQAPESGQSLEPVHEQALTLPEPNDTSAEAAGNEEDHVTQLPDPQISNDQPAVKGDQPDSEAPVSNDQDISKAPIEPSPEASSETPIEAPIETPIETPIEAPIEADKPATPKPEDIPAEQPQRTIASAQRTPVASPRIVPYSPAPALVPLPSPSLTEARFMSNPSPEAHYYQSHPASPAFVPYTSPVPKVSSPLARPQYHYMSPVMSPTATPPPPAPAAPMPSTAPPSTTQSFATAAHSPVMSSAGMVPPYAPSPYAQHPPEPHFMQRSYSMADPSSYAASFQAIQNLGLSNGPPRENGAMSPPENDGEHIELLQRIQSAIPDLNRLLHGFRNTHSRLNSREAEMKQIGNQHEQALMHKEFYIEALQSQMKKTANESAEECAKLKHTINELRLELGNLQEKQKDLEDGLAVHQKSNEELSQAKTDLESEITKLNTDIQDAKQAHEKEKEEQVQEHTKALSTQKQELTELFEEIKNEDEKAATEALGSREKELRDEHEVNKGEWEKEKTQLQEFLEAQRSELETSKSELVSSIAALESKETELESKLAELTSTREELASMLAALEAKEKELEETREKNSQEVNKLQQDHAGEVDSLRLTHEEALAAAAKDLDDKLAAIEAQFNEKEQNWAAERAALEKQLSEKDGELQSSEREKERLEGDGLIKEQQLQRAVDGMRSTIDNLDSDCDRLRKTLHSLGEATDLKTTKGDQFFLDCFSQLSQLIHDLSKEHFAYLPIDPPKDILSKIPPELPSFLENTPASRELRCAYIQHIVSKTVTYRVFQPFLFTLGRRYDKADTFFQMLSMDIRRKSVRREAFWRQQTLKAAYTTSDAKQTINVAAAVIVDEIIDHIKHFADPKHLDSLLTGVRKIVKLAAETWRHARVERELVLATFPAPDAESVSNEGWDEYGMAKPVSPIQKTDPSRHVVLRTFPRILREAAHEDFASGERASPCMYSQGIVLYSDSPVVMARLQELAKKSSETLVGDVGQLSPPRTPKGSQENLTLKGMGKLVPSAPAATLTVQSAPTSPRAKEPGVAV